MVLVSRQQRQQQRRQRQQHRRRPLTRKTWAPLADLLATKAKAPEELSKSRTTSSSSSSPSASSSSFSDSLLSLDSTTRGCCHSAFTGSSAPVGSRWPLIWTLTRRRARSRSSRTETV